MPRNPSVLRHCISSAAFSHHCHKSQLQTSCRQVRALSVIWVWSVVFWCTPLSLSINNRPVRLWLHHFGEKIFQIPKAKLEANVRSHGMYGFILVEWCDPHRLTCDIGAWSYHYTATHFPSAELSNYRIQVEQVELISNYRCLRKYLELYNMES